MGASTATHSCNIYVKSPIYRLKLGSNVLTISADNGEMPQPGVSLRDRLAGALLDSAIDYAIITLDLDGLVTSWNVGAENVLGWSEAEIIGHPASVFFTIEDKRNGVPQAEMQSALTRGRGSDERWHDKKDGTRFWASGEMMPLLDEHKIVQGFIKILRDRTEQWQAMEAHRADAEFLRGVLSSSGDCIKVLDLQGNLILMNDGGLRVMEIDDFAMVKGSPWTGSWPGEAQADAVASLETARAGGTARFQGAAETLKGTARWWDVQVTPILGANGQPEKLLAVSHDITATRSAEERLRHSEQKLRRLNETLEQEVEARTADRNRLWELSTDIMLVAKFDGQIVAVNPAWSVLLGWSERDLIGQSLFGFIHDDDVAPAKGSIAAVAGGTLHAKYEYRYRHKNGSIRWVTWSAVRGDGMINAVGRDVTVEKEQAEALQLAEERLRQSQKMEAVGQLTGGLAHDFNNLLTGIIGSLGLMKTRIAQGRYGETERLINTAEGAAQRAAALTHRLLAFSRRQTLNPRHVDANTLISDMVDLIQRTVGPAIEVRTQPDAALWPTRCDSNQLENSLLNLCINSRDAMPQGGILTIETANLQLAEREAHSLDMQPGAYVVISVTDTGSGMAQDVMARAFDPFFTTKPIGAGTGLGLSMIYGFARQSNGQVRLYSQIGTGTTVKLYLPRHLGQDTVKPAAEETPEAPRAEAGETVLIVDDELAVRMLAREVLEELGYMALEAADGPTGLALLNSKQRIDLLITDVGLPGGMNGRQMADAALLKRPDLKVLFITGYAETAVVGNGHLPAGMHVMTKPFALEALAFRIKSIITGA